MESEQSTTIPEVSSSVEEQPSLTIVTGDPPVETTEIVQPEPVVYAPVTFIGSTEEQRSKFKDAFLVTLKKLIDDEFSLITNSMVCSRLKSEMPECYIEYTPCNMILSLIGNATAKPYVVTGQETISIIRNI